MPREALVRLVGESCRFDDLIADLVQELRGRPYDLVQVRHGLIDGDIRAPQPGAPFAYVTTRTFLEAFGFASLRDLPDLERLKAEGLLHSVQGKEELDDALGLGTTEEDDNAPSGNAGLDEEIA